MRLKKSSVVFLVLILLLLDWLALDDITTGQEPNYYGEYTMLVISVPAIAGLTILWKKITKKSSKS
jgi:hypothetical protein